MTTPITPSPAAIEAAYWKALEAGELPRPRHSAQELFAAGYRAAYAIDLPRVVAEKDERPWFVQIESTLVNGEDDVMSPEPGEIVWASHADEASDRITPRDYDTNLVTVRPATPQDFANLDTALAQLADKDAEIKRLRRLVGGYEAAHTNQRERIEQRDKEILRLGGLVEIERELGDEIDTRLGAQLDALIAEIRAEVYSEDAQAVLHGVTGTHPGNYGGVTKDEALECAGELVTRLRALPGVDPAPPYRADALTEGVEG